jgi:OmcA/MtrC family decaheme c-type cytochrome
VTFKVTDKGTPVDVTSLTTADGQLNLAFAWNTDEFHNLADKTTGELAGSRGRGHVVDLIANAAGIVDEGDGSYSFTLLPTGPFQGAGGVVPVVPLPAGVDGDVMVVLYGRRAFPDLSRAAPESAVFFSNPNNKRQPLVAQANCEKCHELVMGHGNARNGDPITCTACHNSSAGFSDEGIGPLAWGALAHGLHAGNVEAIGEVTYPQSLARCETCHLEGTYYTARAEALPISTGPGPDLDLVADGLQNQNLFDDTWDSATAGTCRGCHASGPALSHMAQNGGMFDVAGGKQLVPSTATEACAVCHGAGRAVDTAEAHAE